MSHPREKSRFVAIKPYNFDKKPHENFNQSNVFGFWAPNREFFSLNGVLPIHHSQNLFILPIFKVEHIPFLNSIAIIYCFVCKSSVK